MSTRRFHFKNKLPTDPAVRRYGDWSKANQGFFISFRQWLKDNGYGTSALNIYSVVARQVIGFLDKPYWTIDPDADIERAWEHLKNRPISPNTLSDYHKGMLKLEEYTRLRRNKPPRAREPNWGYYLNQIPLTLHADIRAFLQSCKPKWKPDLQIERFRDALGHLTTSLRWIAGHFSLEDMSDLTPQVWFAYLDYRLSAGITPTTTNGELSILKHFVHYLREYDRPICERFLLVDYLDEGDHLPRDAPKEQLRQLQQEILKVVVSNHTSLRRLGRMDLAWFLLMLHSGLRTCEVRNLRMTEIDLKGRKLRIEQSKGMKDRIVFMSQPTIDAIQAYLEMRGPEDALPDFLFIYRHKPLSRTYCFVRLRTYCRRVGVHISPHQLRHCCATLLLNNGAPVLSVQALLGHKKVDTTLGYARLYDSTVAADYYKAMVFTERQLALPEDRIAKPPPIGQMIALADSLQTGTLNAVQLETVRSLRAGLMALAERDESIHDGKVLDTLEELSLESSRAEVAV